MCMAWYLGYTEVVVLFSIQMIYLRRVLLQICTGAKEPLHRLERIASESLCSRTGLLINRSRNDNMTVMCNRGGSIFTRFVRELGL